MRRLVLVASAAEEDNIFWGVMVKRIARQWSKRRGGKEKRKRHVRRRRRGFNEGVGRKLRSLRVCNIRSLPFKFFKGGKKGIRMGRGLTSARHLGRH